MSANELELQAQRTIISWTERAIKAEAEVERLHAELRIRIEWFEKLGHPGMAEATRAALEGK